jgi:RimJ/RimL family protein N-acetyltransferase
MMQECILSDGRRVSLRLAAYTDARALEDLFYRLTPESVQMWLCAGALQTPYFAQTLTRYAESDGDTTLSLVAEHASRIIGVARFVRVQPPSEGEIALVIEDAWQGIHLGRAMLRALAARGITLTVTHFLGNCLAQNIRVIRMIDTVFSQRQTTFEGGLFHLRLPLTAASGVTPACS